MSTRRIIAFGVTCLMLIVTVNGPALAQDAQDDRSYWFYIWTAVAGVIDLILLWLLLWGLYSLRIPVARWYYFTFHPHPAEPMVRRALLSGTVLDGPALAQALGELPRHSSILTKVRLEQGERLVLQMQEASRAKIREYERRATREYERAALLSMQEAVGLAAIALEKAKAIFLTGQRLGRY